MSKIRIFVECFACDAVSQPFEDGATAQLWLDEHHCEEDEDDVGPFSPV